MCGIYGCAGRTDAAGVQRMGLTLAHRGPDGHGLEAFEARDGRPGATLGHRRLNIIDPTPRGAQPMSYADGRYWITYNGELYNFRELRRELERDGFGFRSDCDTEVILALYARDGARMLERMNGMFALAIWDAERGELFMARDRLGIKPLYYAQRGDVLHFASEAKALLTVLESPTLRHDVLADYLSFLWVPDPDTLFDGIHQLLPGHRARFAGGRLEIEQYWDLEFAPEERPEREWAGILREAVHDAVRRQMVSDVPLGSFLSGGLDSSAILAGMSSEGEHVHTRTIGFSEDDLAHEIVPDDLRHARSVAHHFRARYEEQIIEPDVAQLLPKAVWHADTAVADPAAIATHLVCAGSEPHLKVMLSGVGGDELFAGYPRYLAAKLARPLDALPLGMRRSLAAATDGRLTMGRPGRLRGPRRNLMKALRGIDVPAAERHLVYSSYYRPAELSEMLSPDLREATRGHDPFRHHRAHFERVAGEHWLNQLLYVDAKTFLPSLNLAYTDRLSMASSTEVRVPLLDDELVAVAARIPPELKLKRMRRKYVFKRSMEGVLPREIIWRAKAGFGAPVRSWVVGELRPMIDDLLAPERVRARGLLEPAAVRRLIDDNRAGRRDNALQIWALLTLELWQQRFIDGLPSEHAGIPAQAPT